MMLITNGIFRKFGIPYINLLSAMLSVCVLLQSNTANARPAVFDSPPSVEAGFTADHLTNNYAAWNSQYLSLTVPMKASGLFNLRLENVGKYDMTDQAISFAYSLPFDAGVLSVDGGYSANPGFLPKNSLGIGWNGHLPQGFGYIVGATQREYVDATTRIYRLGAEKYSGPFRFAYTALFSSIDNSRSKLAHQLQAQWISNEDNRLGLTYAFGVEPEVLGVGNISAINTRYIQLDGLYWLTKKVGVNAALWYGRAGDYYQHNGGQLGLRVLL
ncbi:MAG: YaiO family outer membrane beta-barrel protein [Chlorobiaceae bacterium]|nr:YaiO family outer membrane beta-barrel protein [Chlorobiaceae bacterium]